MRGRLIQKFTAVIARLDESLTAAVSGGGYDPDFNEPLPVDDGTQVGASSKRYMDSINVPCQLDRKTWDEIENTRSGAQKDADIILCLHLKDLENLGLIDSDQQVVFRQGDKLVQLLDKKGNVAQTFDDPPGMFFTSFEYIGHGLECFGTPKQNLFLVYCNYDRKGSPE